MKLPIVKRVLDVLLSLIGLIGSSWLWVLISIAIILEDGFPVLIRQQRIGYKGRIFTNFKFRSMKKSTLSECICPQAQINDPRATRVGMMLRTTALDEMPQLLNILLGDMSFVGPRPLLPHEIEVFANGGYCELCNVPGYDKRCEIMPGLTGIAQVYAPRDLLRHRKFKYDLLYAKKFNVCFDAKLIFLSFIITFLGNWERRDTKFALLRRNGTARGRAK